MSQTFLPDMMFRIALPLLIVTPILAVFLRLAIALANRFIGPQQLSTDSVLSDISCTAGPSPDDSNPYSPPRSGSVVIEKDNIAVIPMPTVWSAVGIVVIAGMLSIVLLFAALGSALNGMPFFPLLGLAISFFIPVCTYALLMPTSFRHAALVFVIQFTMALIFFTVIYATAILVSAFAIF